MNPNETKIIEKMPDANYLLFLLFFQLLASFTYGNLSIKFFYIILNKNIIKDIYIFIALIKS